MQPQDARTRSPSPANSPDVPPEDYGDVARWSLLDAQFSNAGGRGSCVHLHSGPG